MSDEGEKTCPLCAEEMDLTYQQLRPCKCGYDICVWCWHHIMDMAEKDATEGRCPACRTPYKKEEIVGTASKCESLVAEMSVEKRQKSKDYEKLKHLKAESSLVVYITYSKEDEAVRSIQSVHGFVLEGRPLRLLRA